MTGGVGSASSVGNLGRSSGLQKLVLKCDISIEVIAYLTYLGINGFSNRAINFADIKLFEIVLKLARNLCDKSAVTVGVEGGWNVSQLDSKSRT